MTTLLATAAAAGQIDTGDTAWMLVSTALAGRLRFSTWRALHYLAFPCWLLALVHGGVLAYDDLDDLVATTAIVEPRAGHRATYARMQEQFIAAFEALRPITAVLNA